MQKLILKLLLCMVIIYGFATYLNTYFLKFDEYYSFYSQKFNDIEKQPLKTNLIVGSSHGCFGINPKNFDSKSFNFCFTGSNPTYYLNLLKLGILNPSKIDTLFYQVDWFMFDKKWMWREVHHDGESIQNKYLIKSLFCSQIHHSELIQNSLFNFTNPSQNLKKQHSPDQFFNGYFKGFVQYNIPGNKEWEHRTKTQFNDTQISNFKIFIQQLKDCKITIILLSTPEFNMNHNIDKQKGLQIIQNVANSFKIPFINIHQSKEFQYPINYFHDWGHLNLLGANKFSSEMKHYLFNQRTKKI